MLSTCCYMGFLKLNNVQQILNHPTPSKNHQEMCSVYRSNLLFMSEGVVRNCLHSFKNGWTNMTTKKGVAVCQSVVNIWHRRVCCGNPKWVYKIVYIPLLVHDKFSANFLIFLAVKKNHIAACTSKLPGFYYNSCFAKTQTIHKRLFTIHPLDRRHLSASVS